MLSKLLANMVESVLDQREELILLAMFGDAVHHDELCLERAYHHTQHGVHLRAVQAGDFIALSPSDQTRTVAAPEATHRGSTKMGNGGYGRGEGDAALGPRVLPCRMVMLNLVASSY